MSIAQLNARNAVIAALVVLASANARAAGVQGYCTYEGNKHALVAGAVWEKPVDPDDADDQADSEDGAPPQPELMLVFTSFAFDNGELQRAAKRDDALQDMAFAHDGSAKLELTLRIGEGVSQQYLWISPGSNLSYSGSEVGKYQAKAAPAGRMAGHYHYASDDKEGPICDIEFDVPIIGDQAHAPPLPGQPLPAGGGEPGKAYLALNHAMLTGDVDALSHLLAPAQAAEMQKARNTPEFGQQLLMMRAMTASKVRIKGGRIDGDHATLEFDGEEGGEPRSGTVEMTRVDGRWTVVKESTRDRDK